MKKNVLLSTVILALGMTVNAQTYEGVEAICPGVEIDVITIDGVTEDGYGEAIAFLGFNTTNTPDSDADLSGFFQMAWSENGMYIFVSVTDDAYDLAEEDAWTQSLYKYDNIEIFFNTDLTNDAADGARQPEDKQIRHCVGYTDDAQNLSADVIADEVWKMELTDGAYTLETFIPWVAVTSEGFAMSMDSKIGFTINVGDSDTPGGNRDLIMLWAGAEQADEQYKNTSLYGLVTLGQATGINIAKAAKTTLNTYPNPAQNTVHISNADSKLTVFNAIGKKVMELEPSSANVSVDISHLDAGLYIFQTATKSSRVIVE